MKAQHQAPQHAIAPIHRPKACHAPLQQAADQSPGVQSLAALQSAADGRATLQRISSESESDDEDALDDDVLDTVDNAAWQVALNATAHMRPPDQVAVKKPRGYSEGMDANTRVTSADKMGLEVTYFEENDGFSYTNATERLGQMSALFVHELSYHGNSDVVCLVGTEAETDQGEEHLKMFDRSSRDGMVQSTWRALRDLPNATARVEYIMWWREDVLEHIETALDEKETTTKRAKEARSWVKFMSTKMTTAVFFGDYDEEDWEP